jgi:hypothetical protein
MLVIFKMSAQIKIFTHKYFSTLIIVIDGEKLISQYHLKFQIELTFQKRLIFANSFSVLKITLKLNQFHSVLRAWPLTKSGPYHDL